MSTNCFIVQFSIALLTTCVYYSDTSTIVIMTNDDFFTECGREDQVSTILQHQHTSLQMSEVCRTYSLMCLCTK